MAVDLVLSSGFLAFAAQAGFLAGVEDLGLEVDGLCGTSSGALAAALWAAGMPAPQVFEELCRRAPLTWVRPHARPWRGLFRVDPMLQRLAQHLPETFGELSRPLGVGVADPEGRARVLVSGPLVPAVAASCAVPGLFPPVAIDGIAYVDGGTVDRTMVEGWRVHRPGRELVLHEVARSLGAAGAGTAGAARVVHSPRSGARLWSLGDARRRFDRAREATRRGLAGPGAS